MRRIPLLTALMSLILIASLTSCSSKPTILVFAAASLKPTFTRIADQFRADNPGSEVDFDFAGSSELATQLTQGASADVFASADTAQMDTVAEAGLLSSSPVNFASNTLVIVTAPGNPKAVQSFTDLTDPGLRVAVCQQPVPCGDAVRRIEDKTGVRLSPAGEEPTGSEVLDQVTNGRADAGLVYITDAINAGKKVATVAFPEAADATNVYPIAVLKNGPQQALTQKFIDLVTGETGQRILDQAGFGKP